MTSFPMIPDNGILSYEFLFQQVNPSPSDFTSGTFTQDMMLFGIPSKYAVCGIKINPTIAFSGAGVTGLTVSIGVTGQTTFYSSAFSLTQSSNYQLTSSLQQYSTDAHDIVARFTSTGAVINAITAGQVEITVQIRCIS